MLRRFAKVASLLVTIAGCAGADESVDDASGAIVSRGILEVGIESARSDAILTMARPSTRNMYTLAVLSAAAYHTGDAFHATACGAGFHPQGTAPCGGEGDFAEAEVATFDTAADDHAIYVRATVDTRSGPQEVGVVAFRGTTSRANAVTNANMAKVDRWGSDAADPQIADKVLPGAAHSGFETAASRLWRGDTPEKSLRTFLLERHGRPDAPPLYVTGHSLGGAIATLTVGFMFFGECATIAPEENFGVPRAVAPDELAWALPGTSCPSQSRMRVAGLYTYGSPRVGDSQFAEAIGNMLALRRVGHFRVVNANDIITRVAPRFTGYTHVHLNIQGLTEGDREYGIHEDEGADAFYGQRPSGERVIGKCRQWKDATDNPEACPTLSLAYLLAGVSSSERERTEVLRLGGGATEALDDDKTMIGNLSDHRMLNYIPLLKKVLPLER